VWVQREASGGGASDPLEPSALPTRCRENKGQSAQRSGHAVARPCPYFETSTAFAGEPRLREDGMLLVG
jgi:hypothetical protein